ncbi:MAG: hypothetical protein CO125_04010 [Hydrogenophilales bacterium CG_4_9_14_3_um_filter_59_35]|nr:MAG: hypothetical protein COZ23_02295 [Hydrogenophilales bacterium CG_4_10_14_3_um_filter_58_23]PJB07734.1 MAG: hypothetical protein CO125_04010 [Hydrogenophilales bacterium CG_4_9_14_3_um_filter_59_35]
MPQVELHKIHTHAGVEHGAGTVIDVDDSTANWLIEHGVGQAVASAEPRRSRHNEANQTSPLTSTKE